MRVASFVLLGIAGCAEISGLDGLGVCDGACVDVTTPDAPGIDDASDGGVIEAGPLDASNEDTPPTPDATTPCMKPADCTSTQVCCETVVTKGNQYPNCTVDADTSSCAETAKCPTTMPLSCGTYVLRRCAAAADCTEQGAPKCCTFKIFGSSREACLSSVAAQVTDASCL